MTIAEAIDQMMKQEGLNNMALAQMMDLKPCTISRYRYGVRAPNLKKLQQMATVCNRKISIVIAEDFIQAVFLVKETVADFSFDQKLIKCREPLLRFCIGRLKLKKEDAEDVTQETLYRARTLHYTWQADVAMTTWLIGIAKRVHWQNKKSNKLVYIDSYIAYDTLTNESEEQFRGNTDLFKYVGNLKGKQREFYRHYVIGTPYKDIAEKFNTTEGYVKNSIKSTKKYLREKLKKVS